MSELQSTPPLEGPMLHRVWCPGARARRTGPPIGPEAAAGHWMAYWEWNATGRSDPSQVVVCVHGLSRQGRDFDRLARDLAAHARVICPDVAGRGQSEWLANPAAYQVPTYAADMLALLWHLHARTPIATLDWVGTSMGGLIGMALAGSPALVLPAPLRRLVLNDVGPVIEPAALQRIGTYLGQPARFDSVEQAAAMLAKISQGFGPHDRDEWLELSRPMLRRADDLSQPGWMLHYDPAIAGPFKSMTDSMARDGERALWALYEQITADTLLLRGAESDLLTARTAAAMATRGPRATTVEIQGVGHAPTLVETSQRNVVVNFLTRVGAELAQA